MENNPLVSVIIPVYNGERYLRQAIESVLAQSYRPIEILVVDDGSTDGTADIARSYPEVRYIHQANQGQGAAMNAGIKVSGGEYISFLDADDLWPPDKLRIQAEYLFKNPQVGYVIAKLRNFLEPGVLAPVPTTRDLMLTDYTALSTGTLMARKAVFDRVGGFDIHYGHAKDVDWFIRAKEAGIQMAILPEVLLLRRLHETNRSYRTKARTSEFLRVLKTSIDRKRGQDGQGSHQK